MRTGSGQRGLVLLSVLVALAVMAALLAGASHNWTLQSRRHKEASLRFAGQQFQAALRSYASLRGGQFDALSYPSRLEELLEDPQGGRVHRHLRRIYFDPITGRNDWVLVIRGGRIVGLHSRSELAPLARHRQEATDERTEEPTARHYRDWVFMAMPS